MKVWRKTHSWSIVINIFTYLIHFISLDALKKLGKDKVSSCGTVQMMDAGLLGPLLLMNGQSWGSSKVLMLSQHLSASSCCVWIASPAERWKHASQGGGHMPHVASVPQSPLSLWEICCLAFPIFSSLLYSHPSQSGNIEFCSPECSLQQSPVWW